MTRPDPILWQTPEQQTRRAVGNVEFVFTLAAVVLCAFVLVLAFLPRVSP